MHDVIMGQNAVDEFTWLEPSISTPKLEQEYLITRVQNVNSYYGLYTESSW